MSDPKDERCGDDPPVEGGATDLPQGYYRSEEFRYEAPLPPPAWVDQYDRIVPGSAKRMMDDVHSQSAHRREIERDEARAEIVLAKRGQLFGFITAAAGFAVVMTAIVGGIVLIYAGKSFGAGFALALFALAAVAAVFVANRFAARPPRQHRPTEDPVTVRRQMPPSGGA